MLLPLKERLFEIIDGTLFVFDLALQQADISVNYYRKEKSQGNKRLVFTDHPSDKRFSLVAFETIGEAHKEKIKARFGNPYDFVVRTPIRQMLTKNNEDLQQLVSYRYGAEMKSLPIQRVKQYSRACDVLSTIIRIDESRNKLIKELGITVPLFYDHLKAIIIEEQKNGEQEGNEAYNQLYARFPSSYDKLRAKVAEYKEKGYPCVIDKAYGNEAALKVKTDEHKDFLIGLLKDGRQFNDVLVCWIYNTEAEKKGWQTITPATVKNKREEWAYEITPYREGKAAFNEKFIRQVKGERPSEPLFLAEHDDYNINLVFQGEDKKDQWERYVSIMVTDSYCDLVLGKSVIQGENPRPWQVVHAYIDAMYYIRHLVNDGKWYMPWEFKSDRWNASFGQKKNKSGEKKIGTLDPFYNKLKIHCNTAPPAIGNKRRGYLEQFFASDFLKNCEKLVSRDNYNGNNMTAKFRGFNPDMLEMSLKDKSRPTIGKEAETQIEQFFYLLRKMNDFKRSEMTAPSKEEKWLQAWSEMSIEDKNPITDEQFLLTFGITHKPKHKETLRITNRGVEPTINKKKYSYDLPYTWMYNKLQGADVKIIYDPFDFSRVLVTNYDDIRFIAQSATFTPRALKDHYTGSRTFLDYLLAEKEEQVQQVTNAHNSRKILNPINAQALLQSGLILPKELKNSVEQKAVQGYTEEFENFLDENIDFKEFL